MKKVLNFPGIGGAKRAVFAASALARRPDFRSLRAPSPMLTHALHDQPE
jgi:hypothetical protein